MQMAVKSMSLRLRSAPMLLLPHGYKVAAVRRRLQENWDWPRNLLGNRSKLFWRKVIGALRKTMRTRTQTACGRTILRFRPEQLLLLSRHLLPQCLLPIDPLLDLPVVRQGSTCEMLIGAGQQDPPGPSRETPCNLEKRKKFWRWWSPEVRIRANPRSPRLRRIGCSG